MHANTRVCLPYETDLSIYLFPSLPAAIVLRPPCCPLHLQESAGVSHAPSVKMLQGAMTLRMVYKEAYRGSPKTSFRRNVSAFLDVAVTTKDLE